jgi:hypothetical protein
VTSVCIASAAWRRFPVTRLALTQRQRLIGELAARGVQATTLIAADDENLNIASEFGCETLEIDNLPLAKKCNAMLRRAAEMADYVVWIGSDDWLHADLFDPIRETGRDSNAPMPIFSGRSVAVVNLETGNLRVIEAQSRYGCVPWIIDSRLLQPTRHEPIRPDLNRGLDGALIRGVRLSRRPFEVLIDEPHPFRCVDFKTLDNITPYSGVTKHLGVGDETVAWDTLARWYPQDLVDLARQTHLDVAAATA